MAALHAIAHKRYAGSARYHAECDGLARRFVIDPNILKAPLHENVYKRVSTK
jgi:hypothetical protein